MVFLALQTGNHLVHEVVNVEKLQFNARVIDRIWQIVRKGVAEGCYGAVIVRPAPLAKQVREAVHQHFRARVLAVLEEKILPRLLAAPVLGVPEPAR